jgi:hypothetical protein
LTVTRLIYAAAVLALLVVILPIVNTCSGRAVDKARSGQELARDDATARGLEVTGAKTINDAEAALRGQAQTEREAARALDAAAYADPEASARLPDSVRARVRAGDERLRQSASADRR